MNEKIVTAAEFQEKVISNMEKKGMPRERSVAIFKALRETLDEIAADRPAYLAKFFEQWRTAVTNIRKVAEDVRNHPAIMFDADTVKALLDPYKMLSLIYFARLMDHLDDDLSAYEAVARELREAWRDFFAALREMHPSVSVRLDELAAQFEILHQEVTDLFTGEIIPCITPTWYRSYEALESGLIELGKGLDHE